MEFEKHIFISYAHIDNQPLTPERQGWISRFHASLDALLSMRLGRKANIWRDDKLKGNDVFADEITDQFDKTALMISVLTPRYVNSDWCIREIREFCEKAEQRGGVVVENKSRVLKVLKAPIDSVAALPSIVGDVLGYEFFAFEDGAPLELDPAYGEKFAQDYNRKVGKLAWDAAQLLALLEAESGAGSEPQAAAKAGAKATIYLAECSQDRRNAREKLEADLKLHGYGVLPEQRLPVDDEAGYVAEVKRLLERCQLSVHLVGATCGAVPDGPSQKSVVVLQNELAVKRCKEGALQRVIWLPSDTRSQQPTQQAFIDALNHDAEVQFGADLITGELEELKTTIHATLKALEKPEPAKPRVEAGGSHGSKLVYVICVESDRKASVPLRKALKEQGLDVALPAFEGDAAAVRAANQKLLTDCDAVLVFYGVGDEAWKRSIDNELKRMAGYRGGRALLAKYTYLAEPVTSDKQDLIDMEEPDVIDASAGFDQAALAAFLQAVSSSEVRS